MQGCSGSLLVRRAPERLGEADSLLLAANAQEYLQPPQQKRRGEQESGGVKKKITVNK